MIQALQSGFCQQLGILARDYQYQGLQDVLLDGLAGPRAGVLSSRRDKKVENQSESPMGVVFIPLQIEVEQLDRQLLGESPPLEGLVA